MTRFPRQSEKVEKARVLGRRGAGIECNLKENVVREADPALERGINISGIFNGGSPPRLLRVPYVPVANLPVFPPAIQTSPSAS